MASIRPYRTAKGDRRYEVRYRSSEGGERSRSFSAHRDALAFKLDVERKRQAGSLYVAAPMRFSEAALEWLERFECGAAGRVRPRPKTLASTRESLRRLAPLSHLSIDRVRRPLVEDLVAQLAAATPRRAEMSLRAVEAHPPERRGARTTGGSRGLPRQDRSARRAGAGSSQLERRRRAPIVDARIRCSDRAGRRPQPLQAGRASGSSRPRRQLRRRRDLRHRPRRSFWANAYEDSRRAADGRHRAARATAAARTAARANPERSRSSLPDTSRRSIRATQLHGTRVQAGGASGRLSASSRSTTSDIPAPH